LNTALNIVAYQVAWFACVLGAAHQLPWVGTLVALAVVALHLAVATNPRIEMKLILAAAAIGFVLDSALASSGVISFSSGAWFDGVTPRLTPPWMLGLWIAFATTLTVSLRWLIHRPALAIAFGAMGGPLAYYAGMKLGAMTLQPLAVALPAISVGWAAAMWALSTITVRLQTPTFQEPAL